MNKTLDPKILLDAVETSQFLLPELPGKVEHLSIPGLLGHITASSDPFVNIVGAARLGEGAADRTIRQVHQFYASQGKAFGWITSPFSTPVDLNDRLERAGMIQVLKMAGMVLTDLSCPIPANPALSIRRATADNLEQASSLLADAIGFTPEGARATHEALLLGKGAERASVYLAYLPETPGPVGYAALILLPDLPIVQLYCAATLEAYRGRGIYTSLVKRRIEDARKRGARAAVIQAVRATSAPILSKLGFSELFNLDWYIWESEEEVQ